MLRLQWRRAYTFIKITLRQCLSKTESFDTITTRNIAVRLWWRITHWSLNCSLQVICCWTRLEQSVSTLYSERNGWFAWILGMVTRGAAQREATELHGPLPWRESCSMGVWNGKGFFPLPLHRAICINPNFSLFIFIVFCSTEFSISFPASVFCSPCFLARLVFWGSINNSLPAGSERQMSPRVVLDSPPCVSLCAVFTSLPVVP